MGEIETRAYGVGLTDAELEGMALARRELRVSQQGGC